MKPSLMTVAAAAVLSFALVACSQGDTIVQTEGATPTGISVSGTGRVSGAPDVVVLSLGVEVERSTVAAAREVAATAMRAVVESLKANGVAEKEIQTTRFSVDAQYDYFGNRPTLRGYRVTNVVTARLHKIDAAGKAIDDAVKAGGNDAVVYGVSFTIDDPTELEAQAREEAMRQAKARAEQLARHGGVGLGSPLSISESTAAVPVYEKGLPAPSTGEAITPIEAGELEVVITVQVLYAIK